MEALTQSLRPQIERLRRAWRGSPLPGFLDWWGGELRACLPARWRGWLTRGAQWRLLVPDAAGWSVRRPGEAAPLARIDGELDPALQRTALQEACADVDPADLRLALALPPEQVLRRILRFPVAALANLRQVVAYEMDRQTPFAPGQVHYDVRETPPARGAQHAEVELVAVPRGRLDPLLERLRDAGIGIDAVDVAEAGGRLGVNLLPPAQRRAHTHPRRRLNALLATAVVALLVACMGLWLHNRQQALQRMRDRVEALHGEARAVSALRQRLADNAGAAGFLAHRRAQSPTVLAVLEDLTRRLPDGTWLERLNFDGDGRVGMQGQSPQAARLVDLLKGSPMLAEPNFQGVIQTDPRTKKERFYLIAQLRAPTPAPGGKEAGHAPQAH